MSFERDSTLLDQIPSLILGINTASNTASVGVTSLDNSTVSVDDFSSDAPEFEVVTAALTHRSSVMPNVLPSLLPSNIPLSYDSELVNNKNFDAVYAVNIICMYCIVVFIFLRFSRNLDTAQREVN